MSNYVRAVLALALFAAVQGEVAGQVTRQPSFLLEIGAADSLYSEILQESRQFWIHLPNGGDLQEGKDYPVIYLLDGGALLGGLAMVQEFYNYFRLPEMIVVGISNRTHRTRDLTPSEIGSKHGAAVAQSGGAETFTRFIANELIPLIDSRYPTTGHRTLIGHSYAGLFAINTLINRPHLFTNYVAIDPSLGWDDHQWLEASLPVFESADLSGKGLFVAVANEIVRFSDQLSIDSVSADTTEFSLGVRSLVEFVRHAETRSPNGLRFSWKFYDEDIHGSIPLMGLRDGLVFLYDFWELKHPSRYNDATTPTPEVIALIRKQSEARASGMGYPQPMEEGLLDMLGHMSVEADQLEKAAAIFELAIEYYPESLAALDSMIELCLLAEDLDCAAAHAQLAFDISGERSYLAQIESIKSNRPDNR